MTDQIDEDDVPKPVLLQRCRLIARATMLFAPPVVSVGCAIVVGYITYVTSTKEPPADISTLAISILKSGDASPEMRAWATGALGIRTDMPMSVGSIRQ
ncbi:hypothetical protein ASC75_00485 [Aminobacter sp. DSM 101952]|uniref:hypothetical protein n=1 Tax=Aminobacter sp. DSM 101952 TaxID=2735891 RepID=UPI0006F81903|nr:hypothetical protein [Aminobacter sp. DSM 101952]KQU76147.1 hypothetical protein ASC75_00485 [Aminobacter sp. DSM 101952]